MKELEECFNCKRDVIMGTMAKMQGSLYCQPCYLRLLEQRIAEWKGIYKRMRNVADNFKEVKEQLPKLSEYIN